MGSLKALLCSLLFMLVFSLNAHAQTGQNPPVISANGFSCKMEQRLVSCAGAFPSNPKKIFEARGIDVVIMLMYEDSGIYSYDSLTGCLCSFPFEGDNLPTNGKCMSKKGKAKTFKYEKDDLERMKWCRGN